jgi:hypothetical protein
MKFIAFMVMASAWACLWLAPRGPASRIVQMLVFGFVGAMLTLAGWFQWYWTSHMNPDEKSAFVLVCGIGTLLSQAGTIVRGVLEDEGPMPWPQAKDRQRWRK